MNVNNDVFESKWGQIRAQSKAWWRLFDDSDLNKVEKAPIKRDKYVMLLRVKYGYTYERAREEINKRIAELEEANPPSGELVRAAPDRQNSRPKVARVRKVRRKTPKSVSHDNIDFE